MHDESVPLVKKDCPLMLFLKAVLRGLLILDLMRWKRREKKTVRAGADYPPG